MRNRLMTIMLGLMAFPLLFGAARADMSEAAYETINRAVISDHIRPAYDALARAAAELVEAEAVFEAAPSQESLAGVQGAYHGLMDAWMAVEHARFGPSMTDHRWDRFFYWPDKHNTGTRQMSKLLSEADPATLEAASFARGTAAIQGLPALERLLFSDGAAEKLLGADEAAAFRRQLVGAIAKNLSQMALEMAAEWSDPDGAWLQAVTAPGENNPQFADQRSVTLIFYRSLQRSLLRTSLFKLTRPLGESCAKPKPRRSESWRSARSLQNIEINLAALEKLYETDGGFAAQVTPAVDEEIRAGFQDVKERIDGIDQPLHMAVQDEALCAQIDQLRTAVQDLTETIKQRLGPALGLQTGFNSTDGD